jgi:hypothetical protein
MKSKELSSGEHNIKIVKELYNPFSQVVIVKDNEIVRLNPMLSANYSEVTISVENDADIYINEEKKGNGSWKGKLEFGTYLMEAKKESHRSSRKTIEISSSERTKDIQLIAPTPIFGELNITSTPALADVYIDSEKKGKTPLFLPQVIIGNHQLVVKYEGYNDYTSTIYLSEGANKPIEITLNNKRITNIRMECNVPQATLYIDGQKIGAVPESIEMEEGTHTIKVVAKDFKDYTANIYTGNIKNHVYYINMESTKPQPTNWESIVVTYNSADIYGKKKVGEVKGKYNGYTSFSSWNQKYFNSCIKGMKKKAAKLGAKYLLIENTRYGSLWIHLQGSAYK